MRAWARGLVARAALAACAAACAGCGPVPAWNRATLAHRCMRPDARPEEARARAHLLVAREASQGATGERGGGCGCR
ncbi:MAG: DUF4266 domain-containing protein [Polyangiaceae bacterium]|nr:DUF4266 domain-containing protein [Polyangiaceae bacterium]